MFVVPQTDEQHPDGAKKNRGQLKAALVDAVSEQGRGGGVERWDLEIQLMANPQDEHGHDCRQGQRGHDRQPARKRHGFIVNFPMSRVIHEACAEAPFSP